MFYFVPSWYSNHRKWYHNLQVWYYKIHKFEFDDIINYLRMFHKAGENTSMLVLNYSPQLRYFLHRQEILGIPYWSLFDEIQSLQDEEMTVLDFLDLDWPKGTNFIYTNFLVIARQGRNLLAHIEFAEEGNLWNIRWFQDDKLSKEYIFDDRGFLSSILYYDKHGQVSYQDYLNAQGIWQVREWMNGLGVDINPLADSKFFQLHYDSMDDLIRERVSRFLLETRKDDVFVLSANEQHLPFFNQTANRMTVLSLFENNIRHLPLEAITQMVQSSSFAVSDSENRVQQLREQGVSKIHHITPYDTRLRLGSSQQIEELRLYLVVDGLTDEQFKEILFLIAAEMLENRLLELWIGSFEGAERYEPIVNGLLEGTAFEELMIKPEELLGENELGEEIVNRIFVKTVRSESDLIVTLQDIRVIIDLADEVNLYTQIAGISAGIPQINRVLSDYVKHGENGRVLTSLEQLPEAIRYYCEGLRHWNEALVYSVRLIEAYKNGEIVNRWKHYMKEAENE